MIPTVLPPLYNSDSLMSVKGLKHGKAVYLSTPGGYKSTISRLWNGFNLDHWLSSVNSYIPHAASRANLLTKETGAVSLTILSTFLRFLFFLFLMVPPPGFPPNRLQVGPRTGHEQKGSMQQSANSSSVHKR